jgi:hypothetical protein
MHPAKSSSHVTKFLLIATNIYSSISTKPKERVCTVGKPNRIEGSTFGLRRD